MGLVDEVVESVTVEGGVLVGHDGSGRAQEALTWAKRLTAGAGMELHVIRGWHLTTAPQPPTWEPGYVPPLHDFETAVRDELRAHVAAAALSSTQSVTCHVSHGPAVRQMLQAAEGADLLVVGARGLGGFAGLLLGSVSDQCVRHALCPVTVVRSGTGGKQAWLASETGNA